MSLPFAAPGSEARCPRCYEWSPAVDWDAVAFDVFECPCCGEENGPTDAPPVTRRVSLDSLSEKKEHR